MTESMSASSLNAAAGPPGPSASQQAQSGATAAGQEAPVAVTLAAAAATAAAVGGRPNVPAGSSAHNPMALKVNQEVLTSLHLIKDIRRLEKYQRDFFLKVKESLTHVHVLLDHQLMDMAWSDNLADCEENLLKVSTHVQNTSTSQLADVYNILLHDREKLNTRFQELSVKSSLSEFVVNSRQLLDINAVRMAAEAILKNEKPIPAQGDHSIPVDHTFFLANFCTTSLASSMMASFVPKPTPSFVPKQGAMGQHESPVDTSTASSTSGYQQPPQQSTGQRYEKKLNGSMGQPSSTQPSRNQEDSSHMRTPSGQDISLAANANGIDINQVLTQGTSAAQEYAPSGTVSMPPGVPPPGVSNVNMYEVEGGIDKYLQHVAAAALVDGNVDVANAVAAAQNGMYGHELVSAISQIARGGEVPVSNVQASGNAKAEPKQQAAQVNKKNPHSAVDQWGKMTEDFSTAVATEDSPQAGAAAAPASERYARASGGSASGQYKQSGSSVSSGQTVASGQASQPGGGGTTGAELTVPNDASSDSISTESDDGRSAGGQTGGAQEMSNKPLSFARIASLNIEKQAIQRPSKGLPTQQQQQSLIAMAGQDGLPFVRGDGRVQVLNAGMGPAQGLQQPQMPVSSGLSTSLHQQQQLASSLSSTMVSNMVPPPPMMAQHSAPHHHGMMNPSAQLHQQHMGMPLISLPPSNNPRFFFDIAMEGKRLGRVIIEVQPSVAPKMALNFSMLVAGEKGFGYKGCQFFQAWRNESVICGDWEHNSGRGGRAALDGGPLFTPDDTRLPCIRGAVGMRRMSKKHSSLNQVASQFRIILANMNTQFTGIFGHVVSGIEALDKVADMGGEGGRPEKTAVVSACGIYKS